MQNEKKSKFPAEPKDAASADEIFTALRGSLDAIPRKRRGNEWFQASVFVNALFRREPAETFRQVRRLRLMGFDGSFFFQPFADKLAVILKPYTLSRPAYNYSMGSRDSSSCWSDVATAGALAEELGYDWFLNSGTLLGTIRDNAFIPHDDDVDLAILLPGDDIGAVVGEWLRLRHELKHRGILGPDDPSRLHLKLRGRVPLDLFPCWIQDGRLFIYPHTCGELSAHDLLPMTERRMEGVRVKLPASPEKILELNYGPDWQVPDPAWRFDWKAAKENFAEVLAVHAAAKAEAARSELV